MAGAGGFVSLSVWHLWPNSEPEFLVKTAGKRLFHSINASMVVTKSLSLNLATGFVIVIIIILS